MINSAPIDRFTSLHFLAGFLLGNTFTFGELVIGGILFEALEREMKWQRPELFPYPSQDTTINSAFDVAALCLGARIGRD